MEGLVLTATLSVVSALLAGAIGLLYAMLTYEDGTIAYALRGVFLIVMAVPEFITLLVLYFAGTLLLQKVFGRDFELSPFWGGSFALGIAYATYFGELMRGALKSIDRGLLEAAAALGLQKRQSLALIRAPLAIRIAAPGALNLWVSLIKDTSIVSLIGFAELMRNTTVAARVTGAAFEFYALAGLIYLVMTYSSNWFLGRRLSSPGLKEPHTWMSI
ncbi:ABC transporter permease subunit [Phyllobacterium zundukense]|uniref:ABC transporter permease subunit n=1 Tax=Phyllobacterium zundukense TaxID=1867719 RepID=UPI001F008A26|nr:ABC transporter permease subunit [Phyllobacterium zundukense]